MYRYQHELLKKEAIYIAGPECFYTYGYEALGAMRKRAESLGFSVTLPNDDPLDMGNPDPRKRADSIFDNLKTVMQRTTAVIADLEAYRGPEPDAGTVYELGMAWAKGARCYGYTRDKRSLQTKNQGVRISSNGLLDEKGRSMPYPELPFSPCIIGSTKIVEGDFDDCLRIYETDMEEKWKREGMRKPYPGFHETNVEGDYNGKIAKTASCVNDQTTAACAGLRRPVIYLSDTVRYLPNSKKRYEMMRMTLENMGFDVLTPDDPLPEESSLQRVNGDSGEENAYVRAARLFDRWQQHIRDCDIILADLNDFRGYEVSTDVGFECGMAFWLGKKLAGYMDSTSPMVRRVPSFGPDREYRDQTGSNVENFNYPLNLMFACSMDITEGNYEDAALKIMQKM